MENLYKKAIALCPHPRYRVISSDIPYWIVKKNGCMVKPCPMSDNGTMLHPEIKISQTSFMIFEEQIKKFEQWVSSVASKKIEFVSEIEVIKPLFQVIEVFGRSRRGVKLKGMSIGLKNPLLDGIQFSGVNIILDDWKGRSFFKGDTVVGEGVLLFQETGAFFIDDVSYISTAVPRLENVDRERSFAPPQPNLRPINVLAQNLCEDCKFSVFVEVLQRGVMYGGVRSIYTVFCQSSYCVMGLEEIFTGNPQMFEFEGLRL